MNYILDRDNAKELIEWAYAQNPGPWFNHSVNVAKATEKIMMELNKNGYELDVDLGYNAALLHDIGRYKGFTKSVIHSYSEADILAGKQANVHTIGVQWLPNYQTLEFNVQPEQMLSSVDEFIQHLQTICMDNCEGN